jgi:hypothetical protein
MNGRSRPREGGSEKTIAAVNTILAPTAADIAVPQITDNTPEVDAALALAAAGIYVFPVDHPELSICAGVGKHHDPFDGPDHQRGKHPCVAFSEKATTKEQVIRAPIGPRAHATSASTAANPVSLLSTKTSWERSNATPTNTE